jgi:hypothetical protein
VITRETGIVRHQGWNGVQEIRNEGRSPISYWVNYQKNSECNLIFRLSRIQIMPSSSK